MDNFERLNGFQFESNEENENKKTEAGNDANPVYTVVAKPEEYNYNYNSREKPNRKKKGRLRSAIAATLAVTVIGGAAGFGGAYLGYEYIAGEKSGQIVQLPETTTALTDASSLDESLIVADTLATNTANKEMTPAELFEKVRDTVVGIKLYEDIIRGRQVVSEGVLVGSGVIFTTDGYVITNYHVVTDYEKIGVLVNDYNNPEEVVEYEAEVIGTDVNTDLAILKIKRDEAFKAAPIGDSSSLKVGQYVCPIGYPLGMEKSMTFGIVSGLNREVGDGGYELSSIQIDAAVNSGNSGGPLFDLYGNVVGIVNKKLVYNSMDNSVENMGFAITIDEAKPVINDLLAYGKVTSRTVIGIKTYELNDYMAQMLGVSLYEGLYVYIIDANAPVAKSGLQVGDVITKVNGADVYAVSDVQAQIKNLKPGDTIEVSIVRFNEFGERSEKKLTIELTSSEAVE